jgi:hypothetical protein
MGSALISVLLRLLAPEPAEPRPTAMQTDDVFLSTAVAHSPEHELLPAETASVAEFLDDEHAPVQLEPSTPRIVGPEVFMPVGTSTVTRQPSRSAAEFLGPRSVPVWMGPPTAAGPEAFMPSRDSESPQSEVFMQPQSGSTNAFESTFMMEPVPADSSSAVFMSTAR